jgi:hypothetical protein
MSATATCLGGDGFGGLGLQADEFAAEDDEGTVAVFAAGEAGKVALGEGMQARRAVGEGVGVEFRIPEQTLGFGVVERVHGSLRQKCCR